MRAEGNALKPRGKRLLDLRIRVRAWGECERGREAYQYFCRYAANCDDVFIKMLVVFLLFGPFGLMMQGNDLFAKLNDGGALHHGSSRGQHSKG